MGGAVSWGLFLQVTPQATPQVPPQVMELLKVCDEELSRSDLQERLGLADRENFRVKIPSNNVKYHRVKSLKNVFKYNGKIQCYINQPTNSFVNRFFD